MFFHKDDSWGSLGKGFKFLNVVFRTAGPLTLYIDKTIECGYKHIDITEFVRVENKLTGSGREYKITLSNGATVNAMMSKKEWENLNVTQCML